MRPREVRRVSEVLAANGACAQVAMQTLLHERGLLVAGGSQQAPPRNCVQLKGTASAS